MALYCLTYKKLPGAIPRIVGSRFPAPPETTESANGITYDSGSGRELHKRRRKQVGRKTRRREKKREIVF